MTPIVVEVFFRPSPLNVFSHLSLADPLPLSPTLRCETDGRA